MTRTHRTLLCAAVALALGTPLATHAADTGFYIGGLVGYSSVDAKKSDWDAAALDAFSTLPGGTLTSTTLDKNSTGFGVTLGYQVMRNFAVEISYLDLGKAKGKADGTALNVDVTVPLHVEGEFKSHGPAVALVGILPLDSAWALDGRVGYYYGSTEISVTATANGASAGASEKKDNGNLMAGVGLSYGFTPNWSVRLDYLYFNKVGDKNTTGQADVNLIAAGIRYQF